MEEVVKEFKVIQENPINKDSDVELRSDIEVLNLLKSGAKESLLEFDRLVDIALRDE
jgi:hypothetical protein